MATDHGFESVEKRLEISFKANDDLRQKFTKSELERILKPVDCKIEDDLQDDSVDAYILSASSLFVFNNRVIIKTCGDTKIFECVKELISVAAEQTVESLIYTRGTFFWPEKQPFPHQFVSTEREELTKYLKKTPLTKVEHVVMEKVKERAWHVLSAYSPQADNKTTDFITVEMCMKELDRDKAKVFYKNSPNKSMTEASGIGLIFPDGIVSDYEFQPCGYSMNGVEGNAISTIHVAPEADWSFASFEACGYDFKNDKSLNDVVARVLGCFLPKQFTVAIRSTVPVTGDEPHLVLNLQGYDQVSKEVKTLGQCGTMVYYTF